MIEVTAHTRLQKLTTLEAKLSVLCSELQYNYLIGQNMVNV